MIRGFLGGVILVIDDQDLSHMVLQDLVFRYMAGLDDLDVEGDVQQRDLLTVDDGNITVIILPDIKAAVVHILQKAALLRFDEKFFALILSGHGCGYIHGGFSIQ